MFGSTATLTLYAVQVVSLAAWVLGAFNLLQRQKRLQHAEWHGKAARLFAGYCFLELIRIVDSGYTCSETGHIYSVWGVLPWWLRIYSWVLRDILMFRGICVYVEHALVWSHSCMGWPVPKALLTMQRACCYFGNVVFMIAGTIYMHRNDQFWQPVAAMGQIPPNIGVAVSCYYLYRCLQKVPDAEESRHAIVVNISLLVAAFSCVCVFVPWAIPRMLDMYSRRLQVHPAIPCGASMMFSPAPSFLGVEGLSLDLSLEFVELTVGWCGCVGLTVRPLVEPPPGEALVHSSEEVGQLVREAAAKKTG